MPAYGKLTKEADGKTRFLWIEDKRRMVFIMLRKLLVTMVLTILLMAVVICLGVFAPLAHTGSEGNTAGSEEIPADSPDNPPPETEDPWWWHNIR